ncbi:chorismate mutase [Facklamia sp. HMSC062C11]|uniref:Chorismate mutase n=1 Tax=Facklamia hominis TaxID=178214 RepID=A0AAJ1Q6Y6_9LACT|nr:MULTISPECIES: chorismate mutase [Facklamia]EPH11631.1 chorismate mutase [Facklamia hominis ACS-120-V-Sch10]MDK7187904.1 chorismate mutase [Facklamia hominis]OFL66173.1 chorismate mutase [Facklamia sp. HMSC062C11]
MFDQERKTIDHIDRQIVALFEQRTRTVEKVAAIKFTNQLPILDASREDQVIKKVQSYLTDPSLKEDLAELYIELMRLSRRHQADWIKHQK